MRLEEHLSFSIVLVCMAIFSTISLAADRNGLDNFKAFGDLSDAVSNTVTNLSESKDASPFGKISGKLTPSPSP